MADAADDLSGMFLKYCVAHWLLCCLHMTTARQL